MQEEIMIRWAIENKYSIQYKELIICDLREHMKDRVSNGYNYQVHCDNRDFKFSHIYNNLDIAIDKFIGISNQIRGIYETEGTN